MRRRSPNGKARLTAVVAAIVIVGSAVLAPWGVPTWILMLLAPLPWIVWLGGRHGLTIAAIVTGSASLVLLLAVLFVAPVLHADGFVAVLVVWAVAGLSGVVMCLRDPDTRWRPTRMAIAQWGGASVGGSAWLATLAAARFYPGAAAVSWAMVGDSANNVIFAREVVDRGGIAFGPGANPVPLPSGLAAMVFSSGRRFASAADLTRHDVTAFAQTWALLVTLTCVLLGVLAAALVRLVTNSTVVVASVAAGGSLLGLSWFVTGYPIDYGFFNAHLTFVVLSVAILAFLETDRRPALGLATLAFASTATLAVWSPLVLIPAALACAGLARNWRRVIALRRGELALALVAAAQLLAYAGLVSLPTYLEQSQSLGATGGAFAFRRWTPAGLVLAALVLSVAAAWRRNLAVVAGVAAVGCATGAGLFLLLSSANDPSNRWTYYPLKFSWFVGVLLALLVAGLAAAVVARYFSNGMMRAAGIAAVAAGTLAFVLWAPTSGNGYQAINPAKRILAGNVFGDGDKWADQIFALSSLDEAHFLWKTTDAQSEGSINFWLLQIWSDSMSDNLNIKYFAYGMYDHDDIHSLCDIVDAMDAQVTVHTADPTLTSQLVAACPDARATVVVESGA